MNKQLSEVMQRRGQLLTIIAEQRGQMAEAGAQWETRLSLVDKGLAAARLFRAGPALVAGAAALLLFRRHSAALALLKGAWMMWKKYRSVVSSESHS